MVFENSNTKRYHTTIIKKLYSKFKMGMGLYKYV